MIIAVDIGNSNIVLGFFGNGELLFHRRLHTIPHQSVDEYEMVIRGMLFAFNGDLESADDGIVASVVPELTGVFDELLKRLSGRYPLHVSHELKLGIRIGTEFPERVGQDRIANAVAAFQAYDSPLIVIDCGTATTLDVINREGVFEGGLICPGMLISAEALYARAAQLFQINLDPPEKLIGRNTTESMQSGIFYGYCCMIETLVKRISKECYNRDQTEPNVVITGGLAPKIAGELPEAMHDENLTLKGLYFIHEFNQVQQREGTSL